MLLDKDGVKVQFSEYAVAPYSEGTPEVLIPNAYIASPVILKALGKR
ncbi:MAG: RsiV family protein [Methylovulum sp.]|nr:RsiV family protein [Methylovulum sp.]